MKKSSVILIVCSTLILIGYLSIDKGVRYFYINKLKNGSFITYKNIELELAPDYTVSLFRKNRYLLMNKDDISKEFLVTKFSDLGITVEDAVKASALKRLTKADEYCEIYENIFQTGKLINYMVLYKGLGVAVEFSDVRLSNEKLLHICATIFEK